MPEVTTQRHSALEGALKPGLFGAQCSRGPLVWIVERPGLTLLQISAKPAEKRKVGPAVKKVVGVSPPPKVGEVRAGQGGMVVYCIGPCKWLVATDGTDAPTLESGLRDALSETTAAVIDVSHGRTVIRLGGSKAQAVLMAATPVDLHPSVFPAPGCAHSLIAEVAGLIAVEETAGERTYDLMLPRSYGVSMLEFLEETAAQYGYRVSA